MDTTRIEELLECLIGKQDEIISRIESLESTVYQQLADSNQGISDLKYNMSQIYDELVWWGDGHSLAKQVLSALDNIESAAMA
ncbi:hypothetical protein GMSM_45670 [Geomonas sp. Red276]